jgi:PAS domain S-box-containing protein
VARGFLRASDAAEAYSFALQEIAESLGWRVGAAWEPGPGSDAPLRCVAIWTGRGGDLTAFEAATRSAEFHRGQGLPGRVWASGRPAWIVDAAADAALPRRAAAIASGLHAAFGFPLRSDRGVVGVMEFVASEPHEPDAELLATMEALGAQLGQLVERRRAEAFRHAIDRRHAATLAAALDPVVTMDHEGLVLEFNPAAERTFGYPADDAVGREMAALIVPPELREPHRRGLSRYLAGGPARLLDRRIEIDAVRADGRRFPVELTITKIDVPGPPVFTGHLRDISDRRRAEAELKASRARVVQSADAARRRIERDLHDGAQQQLVSLALTLRMLRTRLGQSDLDGAGCLLDEADADLAQAIAELRELAQGIHPALLTDGGLGPALRMLVGRSAVPASLMAAPRQRFPATVEAASYFVVAEALTNAARHAGAKDVEVEAVHADGHLVVRVRDDGVGGADPEGSGLRGLADRVAAQGGSLTVISEPGAGTTLRAEIPCES